MPLWFSLSLIGLALAMGEGARPGPSSAADAVTLRDGLIALGQVVEPAPRGKVVLLVRRAWARANLPDWAGRWEEAEAAWVPPARRRRLERLEAWRRERPADAARDDRLGAWIDGEIARLAGEAEPARSPLMAVQLTRGDVKAVARRPKEAGRMLRQGWLAGFADVEAMPIEDLRQALEGRGFARNGGDAAPVDALLPIMPESDAAWQARRAATEVTHDPGLRFVRHQGLVLPEMPAGLAADATALVSALKDLLGDKPAGDPLRARFREVESRSRTGLVVTSLEMAPDFSRVAVESTLWVRRGPERWEPSASRSGIVRPDALGPGAGNDLIADPRIETTFRMVESLGLGPVPPDLRQKSLRVGAATQRALGLARSAIDRDLEALALPVDAAPRAGP